MVSPEALSFLFAAPLRRPCLVNRLVPTTLRTVAEAASLRGDPSA
jgi:hypothetical protein